MGEEPPAGAAAGLAEAGRGERGGAADGAVAAARGRGAERRGGAREARAPRGVPGLNGLLTRAAQQEADWRTISVRVPESARGPVAFAIDRGDGGQPQLRSTLTLDRDGAAVSVRRRSRPSRRPGGCAA